MGKIIYLLGAGASRGTRGEENQILTGLPIVSEIEGELGRLIDLLGLIHLKDEGLDKSRLYLIEDFQKLKVACSENATIDTYAKKLWLQGNKKEFARVELLLTIFFILEQVIHKPDKRYDTFYANLLQKKNEYYDKLTFPDDIRILSWNYDNQMELVYKGYLKDINYSVTREYLGIYDVKGDDQKDQKQTPCSIIKLNGTANFYAEEDWLQYSDDNEINEKLLERILRKYEGCVHVEQCDGRLRLNFAWDVRYSANVLKNIVPTMVQDATTLVVIGYSFPYFNRTIDRAIFQQMPHLENIYIQDKYPNRIQQNIKPVIPSDRRDKMRIILLNDVEQFYLPPEL